MTTITKITNHYYFHYVKTHLIYFTIFTFGFIRDFMKKLQMIMTQIKSFIIQR